MIIRYKREISILAISFVLCLSIFTYIKSTYFKDRKLNEPIKNVINYYSKDYESPTVVMATTKPITTTAMTFRTTFNEKLEETEEKVVYEYPYVEPPVFVDDGSIIYDGMTLTELTNKLNKSLGSYLTNTGYFFAKFTKDTGMDPYLGVSIVLLETGCKWNCSTLTRECNNIGGLKGGSSCRGGSYRKYDTLEEGIDGYLTTIYNNYVLHGLDTADKMAPYYASSPVWASKVKTYIHEVKSK